MISRIDVACVGLSVIIFICLSISLIVSASRCVIQTSSRVNSFHNRFNYGSVYVHNNLSIIFYTAKLNHMDDYDTCESDNSSEHSPG